MHDVGARRRKECVGAFVARDGFGLRRGVSVKTLGQTVDLLDIENRIAFEERYARADSSPVSPSVSLRMILSA